MIRMARMGKKKQPFYRITVAEKKHPPLGKQIEFIGHYNPKSKELQLDRERAKYWVEKGAMYSRTVGMMLLKEGVLKKEDLPANFLLEKKRKKRKEQEEDSGSQAKPATAENISAGETKTVADNQPTADEVKVEEPKAEPKKEEKAKVEEKKEEVRPEEKIEGKKEPIAEVKPEQEAKKE